MVSNPGFRRLISNRLSMFGLLIVVSFFVMALFANWIAPYPEDASGAIHLSSRLEPPNLQHPFGTDIAGRDILSRVIFGTRTTLPAALAVQALIAVIAVPVGIVAAYRGGMVASVLLRISDIFTTIPPLILALAATTVFKPDLIIEILAAALAFWPWLARVVYSAAVSVKQEAFVEAAKLAGKGSISIMFGDIFPHLISVISVKITLDTGFTILFISTLSFLGLGVQEPTPDWGYMAAVGRNYLPQIWWLATFPGIFILLAVLGFSLLGDGLRDFFDVRFELGR